MHTRYRKFYKTTVLKVLVFTVFKVILQILFVEDIVV